MNKLTVEAEKICDAVKKFHCASVEQLQMIINDPSKDASKTAHFLVLKQYLDLVDGKYVTVRKHNRVNSDDIDCLWAVIDSMMYEDKFDYETFCSTQTFQGGSNKVRLSFIKDNKFIVNVAYISKNNIMDTVFLQNRFYEITGAKIGQEKEKKIVHYFVTRNKSVVEEIKNMKLKMPYVIVYLNYKDSEKPNIQYLNK